MRALHTGFGSKVGQRFKRCDKLRPAVWISAEIDCIRSDEDISRSNCLRQSKRVGKKDRVASGNVRDRNAMPDFCCRSFLWHINSVCERRATEDPPVDLRNTMLFCAKGSCDSARGVDLDLVPLAILE